MVSVRVRGRGEGRVSNVVRTDHREAIETRFRRIERRRRRRAKSFLEVMMMMMMCNRVFIVIVVVGF
jgi:hypothetical protein